MSEASGGAGTRSGEANDERPLSIAEQTALRAATDALARCDVGLDEETLRGVKAAIASVVHFDRIALHVDDEERNTFWVLWRDTLDGGVAPPSIAVRVHLPRDEDVLVQRRARIARGEEARILVAEDVPADGRPIDRALHQSGVRSYVVAPITRGLDEFGALTLAHYVRGAPSQQAIPLLRAIARLLAPALLRTREVTRNRLFATLVEGSPDGMLAVDGAGTIVECNREALRLLDRTRAQLLGRTVREALGDVVAASLDGSWENDAARSASVDRAPGGSTAIDAVIARVEGTSDVAFQIHLRDARPRRAAEEATARRVAHFAFLRELSENVTGDLRVETALERAAAFCISRRDVGGVVMFRPDGPGALRLVASHGAINERTRARLAHVTTKELETMLDTSAADVKRVHGVVEAVGATIDPEGTGLVPRWKILVPLAHARRPLGAMLVLGKPGATLSDSERELWESAAGTVSAALHAAEDFEAVVTLEAERRQLVDSLPVIVAHVDPKSGATLFVNGAIERVLGYAASEVLGTPGMDGFFADPIEWEASAVARDRAARGREASWQDRRYRHKDGRVLTLRESVHPVRDATGAVRTIEVIAYDVSTEIESRKQLMQADRLASIGTLAGGIAHEINNPVAFIGLAVTQLTRMLDPLARAADADAVARGKELLQEVNEAAARIANIVGELKLFTRLPEGAHVTPVDVNRIVQMAVTLTSAELRRRARLEINLGELPLVPGEYASLGQAFVNLLLNAAQAIDAKAGGPAAGTSTDFVRVSTFVDAGAIVVRVSDTGIGIEPRIVPRIFDPFFKMRGAAGEGAGLGLAIAHNLARRVGGDIRVTSAPGEGSTFDVVLPLTPPIDARPSRSPFEAARAMQSGSMRAAAPAPPSEGNRGRVLIVDDEQALSKALARQLADRWDVASVSTARDALAELAVHRYDVVVCDLRMPDQSGPAIHEATRSRSPRQASRFIFTTSGRYGREDDEIHRRAEATGCPILEKPFDGASFESLVERVASQTDPI